MVNDTDGKAEASNMAHGSSERAEGTDIQIFSVLHTPLPSVEAGKYPGCMGCVAAWAIAQDISEPSKAGF